MFEAKNENALGRCVRISADVNVNTAYMIPFGAVFGRLTDLFRRLLPGAAWRAAGDAIAFGTFYGLQPADLDERGILERIRVVLVEISL